MHSLCCVEIFSLSPLEHFLLKTLHMLRWSRPYRAKTGNSPEYTSPSRHWSRARLKTKANKTIPSSQVVYNRSFFAMDANLQPLRYFVIKSIFSASRPTTPILCFCTTKEEASHGGWKTCNDPTHQQHSMVWGSENIISLTAKVQTAAPQDNDDVNLQAVSSAQWVPEPDPLPGISFDTRPDPIQF